MIVYLEVEISIEHFATMRATESFDASMYFHMLVKISSLCEAEATPLVWALVRSLVGVDA